MKSNPRSKPVRNRIMISFEEAYERALSAAHTLDAETVALALSHRRILAETVKADMDLPPFDKAMVDGYACRRADLGQPLSVIETVAAGHPPTKSVSAGEAAKIMTGAMIPEGVDCVFMVEQSEATEDGHVTFTGESTNDNITPLGNEVKSGEVLLEPGHRILAQDVAVLASMGYAEVTVYLQPRVGVVATGDELVEPSEKPTTGQIRNSNGYQVTAQVAAMGADAQYAGIATDDEASLEKKLTELVDSCDVVLFSGGVSMGEFDLVPKILERNGIHIEFDRVAIQPGKPTTFARSDQVFVFGLPGNPVSTFVIFELLVKPFLYRLMGHDYRPPALQLPLAEVFTRKSGTRKAWVPVQLTDEGVRRVRYHGSAHFSALSHADALIPFPEGATELPVGALVEARLIRD